MPETLDYHVVSPDAHPRANVPAALSIACGAAAVVFVLSLCSGVWKNYFPLVDHFKGWICAMLSLSAVINGGIGALRAPRESAWYHTALIGYAAGMFVGALSPIFFLV